MILSLLLFVWACGRLFKPHRRRVGWVLISASLFVGLICGWGWVPSFFLGRLQNTPRLDHPAWKKRNLIVALTGGHALSPRGEWYSSLFAMTRVRETARLYHDCRAHAPVCKVLVSGGDPKKLGRPEAEVMGDELAGLGVKDLLLETQSRNTFQNAEFSSAMIREQAADEVVLVTSGAHLPRAMLFFEHFGIHAEPAPSDFVKVEMSVFPSAQNLFYSDLAAHEILGTWRYAVYNLLGLNKR